MVKNESRSARRLLALVVALLAGAVLVIDVVKLGVDNVGDIVRLGFAVLVMVLAFAWVRSRARAEWVGWLVGAVAAVFVVWNVIAMGFRNLWSILVIAFMAIVFLLAAGWAGGERSKSGSS